MPKKSNNDLVLDLKDIESRVHNLLIDLKREEARRGKFKWFEPREKGNHGF
jgi:hypothetical protein